MMMIIVPHAHPPLNGNIDFVFRIELPKITWLSSLCLSTYPKGWYGLCGGKLWCSVDDNIEFDNKRDNFSQARSSCCLPNKEWNVHKTGR